MSKSKKLIMLSVLSVICLSIWSLFLTGCEKSTAGSTYKKVVVLGFDGVDPNLLNKYMNEGRLPNFSKLAKMGDYKTLGTSIPPQSPVAWSNFITGMNPGGHGIYDFIHRDPSLMLPISSTTRTEGSTETIKIGRWIIPLSSGTVKNLREGKAFWQILDEYDVPTVVFMVPANFPPVKTEGKSISGMGTPDLLGTFGTFSYYTDDPPENRNDISGGVVYPVKPVDNAIEAELVGPKNTFIEGEPDATIPFKVWRDPENATAKIAIQDYQVLLKEKEWSDWLQVEFSLIPGLQSVTGICRFYLKEVRPKFKLYVTPINIDPSNPALPISTPEDYSQDLHEDCGFFYTQGMPEDTKALSWNVFDHADFRSQSQNVIEEQLRLFDTAYKDYKEGLFFFYVSGTDLNAHMFYNMIDPEHPSYDPEKAKQFSDVLASVYENVDSIIGKVLPRLDDETTLIVMSDHGFAPFRRAVHLNTWLKEQGYITLIDEDKQAESEYFLNVDWSRTRAYGLGFNGIYVNLRGREANGYVTLREKESLLKEISEKLLALRDPKNGNRIVEKVYRGDEIYTGKNAGLGPDLVVGYNRGYRSSWETTIGNFPLKWIEDNMDPWSGDHCMAAELVPGVILSNKRIKADDPKLYDLAPTILAEYGIDEDEEMVGYPIF